MTMFAWFLDAIDPSRLAWTLLNTLWQATVIALVLGAVLSRIPATKCGRRYLLSGTGLLLVVLSSAATWSLLGPAVLQSAPLAIDTRASGSVEETDQQKMAVAETPRQADQPPNVSHAASEMTAPRSFHVTSLPWEPIVVAIWLAGASIMLGRMVINLLATRRMLNQAMPIPSHVITALGELRDQLGIACRVSIVLSSKVISPAVVGVIWPTVVLPVSLATGLNSQEVRIVLAHELAHIRRYDFLINLLQMLIEAALFFNPAVWWISRQIRHEREACCDRMAATLIGEPVTYARVLAAWAERASSLSSNPTAVALSEPSQGGPVLDRVRRLLVPDYQPHARVTLMSLLGSLLCGLIFVAALFTGTSSVVTLAKEALSDAERVAVVADVQEEYTEPPVEPGIVTLRGTIRTEDGAPIPQRAYLYHNTKGPSNVTGTLSKAEPTFSATVLAGKTWLAVQAEGYSPRWYGPFVGTAGEEFNGIDLVLELGFPQTVRVTDEQGQPLDGAEITARLIINGSSMGGHSAVKTDETGTAVIDHATSSTYTVEVERSGHQPLRETVTLQADKTLALSMEAAVPSSGIVVGPDGEPVANVSIRMFYRGSGTGNHTYSHHYRERGPVVAVTDEAGRFELTDLADESFYGLLLTHPQFGRRIVSDVRSGQNELRFEIGPDYKIEANIIGAPEKVAEVRRVNVSIPVRLTIGDTDYGSNVMDNLDIMTTDGVGHFAGNGFWPGKVVVKLQQGKSGWIQVPVTIEPDQLVTEVTIDLDNLQEPSPPQKTRDVVIRFSAANRPVNLAGTIEISGTFPADGYRTPHQLPIEENVVRMTVVVPDKLLPRSVGLVGWTLDKEGEDAIDVPPGDEPLEITLPLVPAGAIVGRLTDANGDPVSGAQVGVRSTWTDGRRTHTSWPFVTTDEAGRYYVGPIRLGAECEIIASVPYRTAWAETFVLTNDDVTATRNLQLPATTSVTVQLVDTDGNPLDHIPLSIELTGKAHRGWSEVGLTNRDGKLTIPGLNANRLDDYLLRHESKQTWQSAHWRGLAASRSPQRFTLRKGAVLTGQVLDRNSGRPVIGADVYAVQPGFKSREGESMSFEAEAKTDDEGRFRFSNLPSHPVTLNVRGMQGIDDQPVDPARIETMTLEGTISDHSHLKTAP